MNLKTESDQDTIDKVLENIKQAMESQESERSVASDEELLELNDGLLSGVSSVHFDKMSACVSMFASKVNALSGLSYKLSDSEIRGVFQEVLRPYLKSWLNSNLKPLVKEVLAQEIRRLFSNTRND